MVLIPTDKRLHRILYALHIPNTISREMVAEIHRWTEKSGPEWTVKRLKALKTDFIRITAGLAPSSEWVKYSGNYPSGVFGRLFRWGHRDNKRLKRALNALMSYTSYIARTETKTQLDKFYCSVASPALNESVVDSVFDTYIRPFGGNFRVGYRRIRTVKDYIPSSTKRCPTSDGKTTNEENWLQTVDCLWKTKLGRRMYTKYPQIREVVRPVEGFLRPDVLHVIAFGNPEEGKYSTGFAGKIGHIQEPGLKLRAVANPFRVYQLSLSRLGDQLYELIQTLPWDCTHDQNSGTEWAERKLSTGSRMFAVDLSDATNEFPLQLQLKLLRTVSGVLEEDINLFEDLSTAHWLSPTHGMIRWTKGQPLGLYPSFAAFALTHGVLVASLAKSLGLDENDSFRILGDDIVIADPDLYTKYREVLDTLTIPVSEDKTLQSDLVTEFGGRVIVPGSIITLGKWRMSSDRSFLDVLRNIGPRYLKYLEPRQRKVAEIVLVLPEPIGFGMNPNGLTSLERWEIEEEFRYLFKSELELPLFQKNSWVTTLLSNKVIASRLFRYERLSNDQRELPTGHRQVTLEDVDVLVRISKLTGAQTQPSVQLNELVAQDIGVLERIYKIAKALDLVHQQRMGDPRGASTLENWEKRIKRSAVVRSYL
jgi:hypothetical protein